MNDKASDRGAAVTEAAALLRDAGIEQSARDARVLLAHVLKTTPEQIFAWPEKPLDADAAKAMQALVARRLNHEPLSRILGRREFWSLSFQLSADTLDPRPDSESVIEAVLKHRPETEAVCRILDLGTGTGCLLAALLSEYPAASGVAVDMSDGAARTARQNMQDLGLAGRADVQVGHWDDGLEGRFDIIVSNPPYIVDADMESLDREVFEHDPHRALAGGQDGLDAYRQLAARLPDRLAENGLVVLEFGHGQANDVAGIMSSAGLQVIDWKEDLAGRRRCVVCINMIN